MTESGEAHFEGKELEDLSTALLSLSDYYVTTGLVQRPYADSEVLEVDTLAVRVNPRGTSRTPHRLIVESKSGRWGYSDALKLLGQKVYTGVEHALLVAAGCPVDRVERADARLKNLGLHAVHIPGPMDTAASWPLWTTLAERGLLASAAPVPPDALLAGFQAAARRRSCMETLRITTRSPGYSSALEDAARLLRTFDDTDLHLADPGARVLAVWGLREMWTALARRAVEEEVHGPGSTGSTPEGDRILARATSSLVSHPEIQAMLLLERRAQLDLVLAVTEFAVGIPSRVPLRQLPGPVRTLLGQLGTAKALESLPWVLQQAAWHRGGVLTRGDLVTLAARADVSHRDLFRAIAAVSNVFPDWETTRFPGGSLRRRREALEQRLLSRRALTMADNAGVCRRWLQHGRIARRKKR